MMKRLLAAFVFFTLGLGSMTGMAADEIAIRFATEATYPPFEYMNKDGQVEGFDIDLSKALCAEMQKQCTFTNQPWVSLIPSLLLGKYDALVSSINITADRAKQVTFTDPYYFPSASLIAPANNTLALSATGLQGKTIGVQSGTTAAQYLSASFAQTTLKNYNSIMEAFLDLKAGRLDGVMADTPIVNDWLKRQTPDSFSIVGKPVTDSAFFGQGFAIAVRKDNPELAAALNKALAALKQNGTYDKLVKQYFDNTGAAQ